MKDLLPLLLSEKKEGIEEEFYRADMKADSSHHICTDVHALWTNSLQSEALCNCLFSHGQNTWHYAWVSCWTEFMHFWWAAQSEMLGDWHQDVDSPVTVWQAPMLLRSLLNIAESTFQLQNKQTNNNKIPPQTTHISERDFTIVIYNIEKVMIKNYWHWDETQCRGHQQKSLEN